MAKTKISEWSATPSNNTDIDGINIAEGCAPSGINDAIREMMSQIKDWQAGTSGDYTAVSAGGTGVGTLTGIVKGNGTSAFSAATAGTDYVSPTGTETLTNKTLTSPILTAPVLGTPASGTVTNLTGTASININGTVGATTPTTGAFTTVAASGAVTLSGGTANGVTYLNGSKVLTSGSALTFDGSQLGVGVTSPVAPVEIQSNSGGTGLRIRGRATANSGTLRYFSNDGATQLAWIEASDNAFQLAGIANIPVTFLQNGTEQMRLTSTQLLVGGSSTDLSSVRASIIGSGGFAVQNASTSGTYLQVTPSAANGNVDIKADARTGNYPAITFTTSATTRATLDASGNLGLGVTPPNARYQGYYLKGSNLIDQNGTSFQLNQNNYLNSAGSAWIYTTSAPATQYSQYNGQHIWYNAGSGTAGNAISWTQAMTLTANSDWLLGKTNASLANNGYWFSSDGRSFNTIASGNNTLHVYSSTASAYRFYVGADGTVSATNTTISSLSDARLKENIQDIDVGLNAVMALKPRKFDWKAGKGKDIKGDRGFIAQEFEEVFPNLIDEWQDKAPEGEAPYKSVRQDLIPVLVKAIQEQQAIIESLKARLDAANL